MESAERPWGAWFVLDEGDGYKVKRLDVRPGHRLSYQTHEQRAEHWYVVRGTATCQIDGDPVVVEVGGSIDVPKGAAHRISNQHDVDLVVVEVQLGDYLGEDDIVRIEDDYGRWAADDEDRP